MKIALEHIEKSYGTVHALSDVSFETTDGEFISVIGLSGAGKTTLFRILNGSMKADGGTCRLNDVDLNTARGRERKKLLRQIGMIYQDFCLVESATCMQNVLNACLPEMNVFRGIFGLFTQEQRQEAMNLLKRVGLADKPDETVKNLSGGQKQRVAIARALMQHPGLLLADEPVASLDPVTGRQIMELLREIQQKDCLTVLMNSHNPAMAAEFSDRMIGLSGGRVSFDGSPDQLTEEMQASVYSSGKEERA